MIGHAVRLNPLSFWLWRRLAHAQESVPDTLKVISDAVQAVKDAVKKPAKNETNANNNGGKDAGEINANATQDGGNDASDNAGVSTPQLTCSDSGTAAQGIGLAKPQAVRAYSQNIARILLGEYVLCEAHVLCESGNAAQAEERLRSVLSDWSMNFEVDGGDDNYTDDTVPVVNTSPPKGLWCALLHVSAFGFLPQYMVRALGYGVCDKLESIDWDNCGNVGEDVSLAFEEAFLG
jgi:hypothetical protein